MVLLFGQNDSYLSSYNLGRLLQIGIQDVPGL